MDSENTIIPLCLYSNNTNSYIGLPEKVYQDGKVGYSCPNHPSMQLVGVFYAINPDVKPNPTYSDLLCVRNVNGQTIEISNLYDPFNMDIKCTRFLAWLEQTPGTIRLHISSKGDNIHISLDGKSPAGYQPYKIPNIHVLAPSDKFTFSNSYGKCVPDPQGSLSLDQCIVLYNKNITRPEYIGKYPNILTYLRARYGEEVQSKIFPIVCIVGAIILLICILILLHSALKNIPRK